MGTELQPFRLQCWGLEEFSELLTEAGFTDVQVTADHVDGSPPGPDSETWTFHARRAG